MKKIFLVLLLFIFTIPTNAIESAQESTQSVKSIFNNSKQFQELKSLTFPKDKTQFEYFYKLDESENTYCFQPYTNAEYKKLSKNDKYLYKNIVKADKYWLKGVNEEVKYKQIDYYNRAIKLNPDLHPVIYNLALYYNNKKDYKASNYYLNKLYPYSKIYPEYNYILALNTYNLNDFNNTIIFAKYYLSLGEKTNKDLFPQLEYLIAESALSLSDYNQAITYANQIINNPDYRDSALDIKFSANFELKKYYDALIVARELVKIYPNSPKNYLRISTCSNNKQEKLNNLYKAKRLQTKANDEMVMVTDALIAKLEQEKINIAIRNIKSFFVMPDWEKIQNDGLKMPNDTFYWSSRQDDFYKSTNACIARYKGNELCKCFEAVSKEQNRLTMQRQKDFELLQQERAIAAQQEFQARQLKLQTLQYIQNQQAMNNAYWQNQQMINSINKPRTYYQNGNYLYSY